MRKIRVLVVCTGNSARSLMAEALFRTHGGDDFEVQSAGTEPKGVNPLTERVLDEAGIDHSWARSKSVTEFYDQPWDHVITVCDDANEACPFFPGGRQRLHWSFPDPSKATGTEEQQLATYRRVRDAIRTRIADELVVVDTGTGR